jgi:hypothetical protein
LISRGPDWGGDAFDVVLIGGADGRMVEAVALAGGRVVATPGWGEALESDPGALVAVDVGGSASLPDLSTLAGRADLVCCDLDQLDLVAGALLLTDAELLCAPSMAERIAALAIVAAEAVAGGVREGEAARLRRFSAEVARVAQLLGRLAASEGGELADRRPAYDAGPLLSDAFVDPQIVRQAIRARRLRTAHFGDGLFEDPAWDMLLDLFAAELEGGHVSVSSLCIAAHVAPTTALRWIGRMTEAGLFERRPDPQDRRRAFMALTQRGSVAMRGYVAALGRAGLVLG